MDDDSRQDTVDRIRKIRHDANSPLTAALGHVQLLLADPEGVHDEDTLESLKVVENELQRLIQILSQLGEIK